MARITTEGRGTANGRRTTKGRRTTITKGRKEEDDQGMKR
jgi:hypothetical protein